ncbi:MAG TPA: MerR family transcriptional regulator [Stellaceae bacterium]|nr:MerR family transcriptional regulator [Stellaceae bacterium]
MSESGAPSPPRPAKAAAAFRTIGEVAAELDLPPHVLRFWEAKFPQLRPLKRGGGRRYYRPEDIALLRRIRQCLYRDGYTIRGVQQLLGAAAEEPQRPAAPEPPSLFPLDKAAGQRPAAERRRSRPRPRPAPPERRAALEAIRRDLTEARRLLDALLHPPKEC